MVARKQDRGGGQGGLGRGRRGGERGGFRDGRGGRGRGVSAPPVPPTATTAQEARSGVASGDGRRGLMSAYAAVVAEAAAPSVPPTATTAQEAHSGAARGGGRGGFRDGRGGRGRGVSAPLMPPTATTAQEARGGAHRRGSDLPQAAIEEEAAAGMGAARTARSGAIDTEMRAREGLREMNKDYAPTGGVNTLVARRPRGGMQSGQQTFLGWGRGKSAAQKFSPATARGTTVSSASDRELVRKFVRESILGDPEKYQVPYHLKPRKDPFAGEWDPDWVVLGGLALECWRSGRCGSRCCWCKRTSRERSRACVRYVDVTFAD